MCHLTRLIPTHLRFRMHKLDTEFYQRCYQVLFFREASWVLASPILEQLQSLSIHLSQIGRYAAEVGRLRNLKTVIFIIDEIALEPRLVRMPGKRESEKERRENAVRFRPMVQFVEEHVRLFGGVLKSVKMVGSGLWTRIRSFPEVYSDSIQMEINRLLPVLWTPAGASLSHDEMLRFLANPEVTDLSGVVKINAWGLDVGGRDVLLENRGALQRCRALKRLKIQSLGEGSFKWAVDKNNGQDVGVTSIGMDGGNGASGQPEYWREGLVPLEEVEIWVDKGQLMEEDVINDVAFGFSQTLKSFKALYCVFSSSRPIKFTGLVADVGQGWVDLPLLTRLNLYTSRRRLGIDRNLLVCYPNVVSVELSDDTLEYRCEEIVPCLPAHLSSLETLNLSGLPALTFHPATLDSTTRLKELLLTCNTYVDDEYYDWNDGINQDFRDPDCFIPPIDELNRSYGIQTTDSAPPLLNNTSSERVIRP
ncbi:hypothetical protein BGX23_007999 [Mortierella sp. AD031]|nr:hypothetical protein BGX23_007999 [Mortierella sp. AD031]